jgi:SAM-dependent methyltransferase
VRTAEEHDEVWASLPEGGLPWARNVRERFLLARVGPGKRVLDLGCGEGWACGALLGAGARPVGVDISSVALERAARHHPGIEFAQAHSGEPLPFGDAAFDAVWASEVLAHVADPDRLLGESYRVLRPGGLLLATTGHYGWLRGLLHRGEPPLRHDTRRALRRRLRAFGFEEVAVRGAGGPRPGHRLLLVQGRRPLPG